MNIYGLDFNLIKALHALIEKQNVSLAAEKIGLSQPAMSASLSRLRSVLSDPVLVQSGRKMSATPKSLRLFPIATRILNDIGAILRNQEIFNPKLAAREYTVTTSDFVSAGLLPKILSGFEREAPACSITIKNFVLETVWQDLEDGSSDFALGVWNDGQLPSGIVSQKLSAERFKCAVRTGHPSVKKNLTLKKFTALRHLFVSPSSKGEGIVDELLRERGLKRNIGIRTPNFMSAAVVLSQSDYVTTLPEILLREFKKTYPITILDPPFAIPGFDFKISWAKRFETEPSHLWLKYFLTRELSD